VPGTLFLIPTFALAQSTVDYQVKFPNAVHHEARITVSWTEIGTAPLEVRMSRSSPGRYAIHEFAKNVYSVEAVDGSGQALEVTRPNPYQWDIAGHDGNVTLNYTLYADRAGGTYSGIDTTHAHLNMPATFMWARGFDGHPIRVAFDLDGTDWKVATQLVPTSESGVFTAPDLQYFMDSPTELSNFSERQWVVESNGEPYTMRLAVHHDGTEGDVDEFLRQAKNVVDAQVAVFGELPDFDYGGYVFIADYLPYVSGDGMEHRNSTVLTNTRSLHDADFAQLGTLSHEFIHAWNAERIRPTRLEPFNFEQANMSLNLWFVEGFTSYYGPLTIRRAGESTLEKYVASLAGPINTVTLSPGRSFASPQGMSTQAPFVDAATSIDPTNFDNTFISYYTYGAAIALALDLTLRSEFTDLSLDSFMRAVWVKHGKTEVPYTTDDLQTVLADVTGNADFAEKFFSQFVRGRELPDYEALLGNAGLLLRKANSGSAWLGRASLEFDGPVARVGANTLIGSPLYEVGIDRGDEILSVGRFDIDSEQQWTAALERHEPGDTVQIRFLQRGMSKETDITFAENPRLEVLLYESADMSLDRSAQRLREAWLGDVVRN